MTPQLPSNKKFGLLFTAIFFALSLYAYFRQEPILTVSIFLLVGLFFLIASFFYQNLLNPLNKAWFMLGLTLGKVVSPIVLGIIFFGLLTPIALLAKLTGRDELKLKRPNVISYWADPVGSNSDSESFKNQF
jgi:Saxitoxin biosynthesis operon protein SxtJ